MTKEYTPIHDDKDFNIQWWEDRGYPLGESDLTFEIYLNVIRDASGRYEGFVFIDKLKPRTTAVLKTVADAEAAIKEHES